MRWLVVLALGAPVLSGCNIVYYAGRNIVNEPAQTANQFKLRQRMRAEAREAWEAECARNPGASAAFGDGFVDGYADYLNNGGTPAPPAAPPARYRRHANDFTEAGLVSQRDYMNGFFEGAKAACVAGSRAAVVVHVLLPEPQPEPTLNITCVPAPPDARLAPAGTAPPMFPPAPPGGIPLPPPRGLPEAKPGSGTGTSKPVGPTLRRPLSPVSWLPGQPLVPPVDGADRTAGAVEQAARLTAPTAPTGAPEVVQVKRYSEPALFPVELPP